jgi:hypothetical protein
MPRVSVQVRCWFTSRSFGYGEQEASVSRAYSQLHSLQTGPSGSVARVPADPDRYRLEAVSFQIVLVSGGGSEPSGMSSGAINDEARSRDKEDGWQLRRNQRASHDCFCLLASTC